MKIKASIQSRSSLAKLKTQQMHKIKKTLIIQQSINLKLKNREIIYRDIRDHIKGINTIILEHYRNRLIRLMLEVVKNICLIRKAM